MTATCDICGVASDQLEHTNRCPSEPHGRLYDLYAFDIDGTLIEGYMDAGVAWRAFSEVTPLPGRIEKLAHLLDCGAAVALVTNQAGVAFAYQSVEETRDKLIRVVHALGLSGRRVSMHIAFGHARSPDPQWATPEQIRRRKPNPEMLLEAIAGWSAPFDRTLFVGDMDSDHETAHNAGVAFAWSKDFF